MAQTRQHESVPCGAEAPVRGVEPGVQDLHVGGHVARLRGARRQGPRDARRQGRDRRFDRYAHRLLGPFQRHPQRERVALRHHPRRIPQQQLLPPDLRASGQGPHGADPRRCEVARLQHAHGHRGGFMPRRGGFAVPLRQLGPAHRRTEQRERQDALGQHHAMGFQDHAATPPLMAGTDKEGAGTRIPWKDIRWSDPTTNPSARFTNPTVDAREVRVASYEDYQEFRTTATSSSRVSAYSTATTRRRRSRKSRRSTATGATIRTATPRARGAGYGMRGCFVYNSSEDSTYGGRNLFFPAGHGGIAATASTGEARGTAVSAIRQAKRPP